MLWEHLWKSEAFRVTQPHILGDHQVLIGTSMTDGTRLLTLAKDGTKWVATEVWTAMDMKPYFNDFVTHEGFAYGFDGPIFLCIDLATGKKTQLTFGTHDDGGAQFLDAETLVFPSTAVDPNQPISAEVARNGNIYNVWTLSLKTNELKQFTDALGGNVSPVVLRDENKAQRIAFITYYKGEYGIHTVAAQKEALHTVATADFGAPGPSAGLPVPPPGIGSGVPERSRWASFLPRSASSSCIDDTPTSSTTPSSGTPAPSTNRPVLSSGSTPHSHASVGPTSRSRACPSTRPDAVTPAPDTSSGARDCTTSRLPCSPKCPPTSGK